MIAFLVAYWAGMLLELIIRAPFGMMVRTKNKAIEHRSPTETILLSLLTVVGLILPLVYTLTRWFHFANYHLPLWMGWIGVLILVVSVLIFGRAHLDLKSNWSPSLEIYEEHTLITNGIYRWVRHPMYLSQLIWGIAQILLLQNWIAGPGSLILFFPFYFLRRAEEEKMMLAKFGDRYLDYLKQTGGIFPKL
jgi:protein-S-isoprenylcysteine O-methyltransferase Ste14